MRRTFRIINGLFWLGVYVGAVLWTGTWGHWVPMIADSFIPIMLWMFIHIALRPHPEEG